GGRVDPVRRDRTPRGGPPGCAEGNHHLGHPPRPLPRFRDRCDRDRGRSLAEEATVEYRELGRTGLRVSEIGYGAWGIGASDWVGATENESLRALHRAIDLGVNFIDTARGYGDSERIVGTVVRDRAADEVYVATKVPPKN